MCAYLDNSIVNPLGSAARELILSHLKYRCSYRHMWLCSSNPAVPNIPYHAELVHIFPAAACENEINWTAVSDTFPRFIQLLAFAPFTYNVLLGLMASVGGLTESLVS
jgi:hypothetical protein